MTNRPELEGSSGKGGGLKPLVQPPYAPMGDAFGPAGAGGSIFDAPQENETASALSLATLLESKRLILVTFVLLSLATIPWVWVLVRPRYDATANVRVSPLQPKIVFSTDDNRLTMGSFYVSFLNTQVAIVKSPPVLQRALERAEVRATTWYQQPPRTLKTMLGGVGPTHLDRLKSELVVEPQLGTELIDVRMSSVDKRDATTIVNVVVEEYKKLADETAREFDADLMDTLVTQQKQLEEEIAGLLEARSNLSKLLGTGDPDEVRTTLAKNLSELEAEYDELKRDAALTKWDMDRLQASVNNGEPTADADTDDAELRYGSDPTWRRYSDMLQDSRRQLAIDSQHYGEQHVKIVQLKDQIGYAAKQLAAREALLDQEQGELTGGAGDGGATAMSPQKLQHLYDRQLRQLELLGEDIRAQRARLDAAGDSAALLASYDEQLRVKRDLRDAVRSSRQVREMESKAPARISIASPAAEPSHPTNDRRFGLTAMALAGSMFCGLALAYVRAAMRPKIYGAQDVQGAFRVAFLGQVPQLDGVLRLDEDPRAVESIRMVRTALLGRLQGTDRRVVLVAGSTSSVGKTTVAIGLARSLAHLGKKTLLVEGDLHNPVLSKRMGIDAKIGLAAILAGKATDEEAIQPGGQDKLKVIVAGEIPPEYHSELLANGVFASCLARWKKEYDFVLLDSPPVLPVVDARILAGHADGTIMVLRASQCLRAEVVQAYDDLTAAGARVLGTVLVGGRSSSRYGYGYGHYGYGPSPAARVVSSRALTAQHSTTDRSEPSSEGDSGLES